MNDEMFELSNNFESFASLCNCGQPSHKSTWKPLNPSIIKGDVWKSILDDGWPRLVKKKGKKGENFRNQLTREKPTRDELTFIAPI